VIGATVTAEGRFSQLDGEMNARIANKNSAGFLSDLSVISANSAV